MSAGNAFTASPHSTSPSSGEFVTTSWTTVFSAADPDNAAAREHLVRLYWFPLYAFARWKGQTPTDAEDVVQSFLGRLVTGQSLAQLERSGGRFRDFLRVGLTHEIISRHRAASNSIRRPSAGFVFADGLSPERRRAIEPLEHRTPEQEFDRLCARGLLEATAARLEQEYAAEPPGLFAHCLAHLEKDVRAVRHAEAAAQFGLSEGTLKNKMTVFRTRFRQCFRQEVAATLADASPEAVDQEIHALLAALAP